MLAVDHWAKEDKGKQCWSFEYSVLYWAGQGCEGTCWDPQVTLRCVGRHLSCVSHSNKGKGKATWVMSTYFRYGKCKTTGSRASPVPWCYTCSQMERSREEFPCVSQLRHQITVTKPTYLGSNNSSIPAERQQHKWEQHPLKAYTHSLLLSALEGEEPHGHCRVPYSIKGLCLLWRQALP